MGTQVVITPSGVQEHGGFGRIRSMAPLLRLWIARDLRARYREGVLHASWTVIQPVTMLLTYGWVFSSLLQVDVGGVPYLSFAWAGMVVFNFVQQSLSNGVGVIHESGHLISKVYFPREVLPLSVVGVALVDLSVTFGLLVVLAWVQIGPPSIHIVGAVLSLVALVAWTAAATVAAAATSVYHRDLKHAMPLILRVVFILTPIFYGVEQLGSSTRTLLRYNPLSVLVDAVRDGTLLHRWPDWRRLGLVAAVGAVFLVAAFALVQRAEHRMSDRV